MREFFHRRQDGAIHDLSTCYLSAFCGSGTNIHQNNLYLFAHKMAKEIKSAYNIIGIMAGSSMDGLDVASAVFSRTGSSWKYEPGKCVTYPYDDWLAELLKSAGEGGRDQWESVDTVFGKWIADHLLAFGILDVDLVALHGHTVLHEPEKGQSVQLGSGQVISEVTQIPCVSAFRSLDVSLGGQGAPLVPKGDFDLFSEYDACINLGGIANVSLRQERIAWDICPCNQVLNDFASRLGHPYDSEGTMARKGKLDVKWIERLAQNDYFTLAPPKSLPNGFFGDRIMDMISPVDGLKTYVSFIVSQVKNQLAPFLKNDFRVLVTGGGAHNDFLVEMLSEEIPNVDFTIPDTLLVNFKEALVFGYLGLLKMLGEDNVMSSVTGATRDSCSGILHAPK